MKRTRATSAENVVQAMVNAAKEPLSPPDYVTVHEKHRPFWESIIRARARDEWSDNDLVVAAQLARCQYDIEAESLVLEGEGTVVRNDRGTQVANPRVSVLEQLARREMALMRTLRMGGRIAGDSRDEAGRRGAEQKARKLAKELEDEDLLA